ncbi:MAG: hypothetical protein NXH81_12425 [Halieaceae bacterium]|uniref:phenylacetate--CoA ligase family protein n=1 Tax=Haliea alexandrii TaxID=2448162 RepID=UPI001304DE82|nr:phenylacetate--CoA ligase family protein [Haliea alexandrii]MCR9186195.1 hypothetical protein [Halieaceae bacterium]
MSFYQKAVAGLLFPLQERLKGHDTITVHKAMEASQWLTPEALAGLQLENLRRFLLRVEQNVPYYHDLFKALDFKPEQVSSLADLQCLPLLDKATIRAHTEAMKARGAQGLKRFNTGGSSGEPLIFFLGKERVSHDVAAKRRATRWWGVDIGDREIVVWGSPIELGAQDRVRLARDALFRTELLSAFEMSRENLQIFVERIVARRPFMLFGYPSSLALIAQYGLEHEVGLDQLGVKVAFVTSERLYEHQRKLIERVFGCPVANGYGGRDAGFIAHACPEGSLHITAEDMVVEIVDREGRVLPAGKSGEIVVTHLFTSEFPFLRYKTGDVGVLAPEPCICGRGLPVLASVEGRTTDFMVAADGTILHGLALIYVLRDMPDVANFRIVQESLSLTRVEVVPCDTLTRTMVGEIESGLRARLGEAVQIDVVEVDEIPREASGKFRYVVSRVAAL